MTSHPDNRHPRPDTDQPQAAHPDRLQPEARRCPCGSQASYADCCQRWHRGQPAPDPEALMRSRYTAFVLKLADYLLATWHPDTRPAPAGDRPEVSPHELLNLDDSPAWASLQVFDSATTGDRGSVHFRAIYRAGSGWGYLEEHSDFLREAGCWYYLSGRTTEGTLKPGRNDPCPCGSGRKYKACCL